MTRFSLDILLPFPNSNDLNSREQLWGVCFNGQNLLSVTYSYFGGDSVHKSIIMHGYIFCRKSQLQYKFRSVLLINWNIFTVTNIQAVMMT